MRQRLKRSEDGFTLIELLIAIVVSGVLLSALTTGFIATIRGTKNIHDRFVQEHDAQLLAAYFPADVQSANPNLPITMGASDWATVACPGGPPAGTTNILGMQWSETVGATTTPFAVSYRLRPAASGSNYELVRYFCSGGTVRSDVVAHSLAGPAFQPTVPAPTGQTITMTLVAVPPSANSTAGNYSFTFSGNMRTPVPPPAYPSVLSINRLGATPTNAGSGQLQWRVTFDRNVTGVDPTDFVTEVTNLSGVGAPTVSGSSGSSVYTVSVTVPSGTTSGAVGLDLVDNDSIKDASANLLGGPGTGATFTGQSYEIDRTPPSATIALAAASPTSGPNLSWTVTFTSDVTGVDAGDFTLAASGVTTGTTTLTWVSPTQYTVTNGPVYGTGTLGLNLVDNNSIIDAAGNPLGSATGAADGSVTGPVYTVNGSAPAAPSVSDIQLKNGSTGTPGKIEEGDSLVITFSAPLKVGSLCSAWAGDGNNQSLTAGNDVTVTITNSAANDVLTVASTSCTFNFGQLALGGDYVSGIQKFDGNGSGGNTPSKIAWDANAHTLTITLGKKDGNNVNSTASTAATPSYTASSSITDPYGQHVSPLTSAAPTTSAF